MREIKFRAWNKEKNIMMMDVQDMYDSLGTWYDGNGNILNTDDVYEFPVSCFGAMLNDGEIEIMQYTGLKDKNGKEIYEGDIVKVDYGDVGDEFIDEVVFYKGSFFLINTEEDIEIDMYIENGECLVAQHIDSSEVIGNIYENKDLIK